MAMKRLVHALRGVTPDGGDEPVSARSSDPLRWAFHDLVARRIGFSPWGLSTRAPPDNTATRRREPATEPHWADTQPSYHR